MFGQRLLDKIDISLLSGGRDGRQFTPDLWQLEQREWQLLFLPDDFMSRHPRHPVIQDYLYPGLRYRAYTAEGYYAMWMLKKGQETYPIPLINRLKRVITGRIAGELVAIRPYMFIDLDKHRLNGLMFNRIRGSVIVPYRKEAHTKIGRVVSDEFTDLIRCWMYVGRSDFWEKSIDGGYNFKQVHHYDPPRRPGQWWPGRYFYFDLGNYPSDEPAFAPSEPPDFKLPERISPYPQQTFTVRQVINGEYVESYTR